MSIRPEYKTLSAADILLRALLATADRPTGHLERPTDLPVRTRRQVVYTHTGNESVVRRTWAFAEHFLPTDSVYAFHLIEMFVVACHFELMLARQRSNPDVVFRDRFRFALQFMTD